LTKIVEVLVLIVEIEKNDMIDNFERFEIPLDELILDPTCFMAKEYLQGTIEVAKSPEIKRLWIPTYLLEERNLIDALYTWEPQKAGQWFPWISSGEFSSDLEELVRTDKLTRFETPKAKTPFRAFLAEVEKENEIGAVMCAEILSFSFESERVIFSPELGLTDVLKRSGKALIRFINKNIDKKQDFFASIVNEDRIVKTRGLRWIMGGFLSIASLFYLPLEPVGIAAGIALWVLDP
jgi:hypothetical protein